LLDVLSAHRATPATGALLATLLGAGGDELEAAGRAGGDPDAAEQMQGWLVGRERRGPGLSAGSGRIGSASGLQSWETLGEAREHEDHQQDAE
jgi:hypothetical protein